MDSSNEWNQLIMEVINGNHSAFGQIYEETIRDVYRTVYFLIEDKTDLEDIVQEIYLQLYKSLSTFNVNKPFRPWLMGIVIRQINSYRRKRWMRFRILNRVTQQLQETHYDFSDELVDRISNEELFSRIQSLPYKLKQIIILHYLHEYSQEEVSQILGIPLGTVKSRINSALKKLRQSQEQSVYYLGKVENEK
jgi:RNA polymerase sigma-70 factor (ECF subfamily)